MPFHKKLILFFSNFALLFESAQKKLSEPRSILVVTVITIGVLIITFFRGLIIDPAGYAVGHWFLSYKFGFVRRGLIGTLMLPLLQYKDSFESLVMIKTAATLVLFLVFTSLVLFYSKVVRRRANDGSVLHLQIAMLVYASSSGVIIAAFDNAFLDHFLELLCLLSVIAAMRRKWIVAAIATMVALCVHEIYMLYCFPIAALAVLRKCWDARRTGATFLRAGIPLVVFGAVFVTTVGAVYRINASPSPETIKLLTDDIQYRMGLPPGHADAVVFHLKNDHMDISNMQHNIAERFTDPPIALTTFPTTGFLLAVIFAVLYHRKQLLFFVPTAAAVLAPLILHFIAWDTERFSAFTTFNGLTALFIVSMQEESAPAPSRPWSALLLLLAVGVFVNNLYQDVYWARFSITEGPGNLRRAIPLSWFEACPVLFENSNFDAADLRNWAPSAGFVRRPNNPFYIHLLDGPFGLGYLAIERKIKDKKILQTAAEINSIKFQITKNEIMFIAKTNSLRNPPYVALEIEKGPTLRTVIQQGDTASKNVFDVRAYKNKYARIHIVNPKPSREKTFWVDAFCWSRR